MKNKKNVLYSLMIMLAGIVNFAVQAQQKNGAQDTVKIKDISTSQGPNGIVRTIKQDRKGNIWITSWEGVFKYDGKSFTNITSKVSSARFFSVLEDRRGNFWFASIGSGVYYYDGKSFQNFTTKDGLASDGIGSIYEDKVGNIWFGTGDGASRYDGKSFRNLKMSEAPPVIQTDSVYTGPHAVRTEVDSVYIGPTPVSTVGDSVHVSAYQKPIPEVSWMHNDVNAIVEDNTGKFWFGTRGYATVYDGKTFATITNAAGKPFTNVRSIIKDKKGNIWLGGYDGLWRYNGKTFTNFSQNFVGYIFEDKKGNILTSSASATDGRWELSRYDAKSLTDKKPTVTVITNQPMIFGILEDDKENIWFGALDGVYRYDGKTITDFKTNERQK
ncbi:MAG: two-component regulator propeller domain-containing protein [Flavobacterium sp.]|nr:two-component regulator propeller domain-containing protein [Flavobacterium sp.]